MDFDVSAQVDALAKLPPEPPKPVERSAWGWVPRIGKAAVAGVAGSIADVVKGAAAADALTLGADPRARAALTDEQLQAGQAEGMRQIATSEALTSDIGESFRQVQRDARPDPLTAGTAEQLVFGVGEPLLKLIGGGMALGPFGLAGASAEMGFQQSDDLRRQGVDIGTRTAVGALTAGVTAASVALPMVGPTLKATAGLYLAGGPGGFMAQQALTAKILEHADYGKIAQQFDWADPMGLALSALIPLPFAGFGAMRNIRAMKPAKGAAPVVDAPPVPEAPTVPREAVDAAMVHNLTLQRDVHEAGQVTPATAQIPRAEALPPMERAIEGRMAEIVSDLPSAIKAYAERPDSMGGKVLNTDIARELSPDYLVNRTKSAAVHEPASWFIKQLYAQKLADMKPGDSVVFTSGGTGAGKSSAMKAPDMSAIVEDASIVYDTNLNTMSSAVQKVEQALQAGADVQIVHVQRDPVDALLNGALSRAMGQEAKFGTGRTVPLVEHARTHRGAADVIQQLATKYKDDQRVTIRIVDNTRGKGGAKMSDLGFVRSFDYNGVEGKLHEALKQAHDAGRISGAVFRATQGAAEGDIQQVFRRSADQGPERANSQIAGPSGSETVVVTERGLTVPAQYRVVEADALVTSHTNDLAANPAFPAELQPRDRTRAASAEQIARIENAIRPELLGESVKASDGAPIVGPDAVVESGNARTIALRRAYDTGKADGYREWLGANAQRFGLNADQVRGMNRPVLVRERLGQIDRAEFARQANESPIAGMSPVEQARADAARMKDLSGLVPNEDGTINLSQSRAWIQGFMRDIPPTERGTMMQGDGQLSQIGVQRIRNAVFAKAYGDPEILAALSESTNSNIKNILAGLLRAAPDVARMQDLIGAGARQPMDFAPDLVRAVRELGSIRERGITLEQYLSQGDMLDGGLPAAVNNLLVGLSENARAPKRIAEMVRRMVDAVDSLGDPRQAGMFDDASPTKGDVTADAVERMRALTDDQLTGTPPDTIATKTDPLMQSISDRVAAVEMTNPDMPIGMREDGTPITVADELARIRKEALEGTDTTLGSADADLVNVAANCALAMG